MPKYLAVFSPSSKPCPHGDGIPACVAIVEESEWLELSKYCVDNKLCTTICYKTERGWCEHTVRLYDMVPLCTSLKIGSYISPHYADVDYTFVWSVRDEMRWHLKNNPPAEKKKSGSWLKL